MTDGTSAFRDLPALADLGDRLATAFAQAERAESARRRPRHGWRLRPVVVAALLFALSTYAVELGQEAALYSLAALTTTAALAAGWRWRTTGRGSTLYITLAILAIYSHYVVALILALFALLVPTLATQNSKLKTQNSKLTWVAAHAIIFAAWLPWLADRTRTCSDR